MCQLTPYSHTALPWGKTCSRIQTGKKASGQLPLPKEEHCLIPFWQQGIQLHSTELT